MEPTLEVPLPLEPKELARFRAKVKVRGMGCWLWTGALTSRGYGSLTLRKRGYLAHRVAYALEHGPIPPDLTVDHRCLNTACVNPSHLQLLSLHDNARFGNRSTRGIGRQG